MVRGGLMARLAAGESGAARECVERFGPLLRSLARRFFVCDADAEDAVQDILVSVWRSAGRYDPRIAGETTFVAMIARRRLIDRRRVTRSWEALGEDSDPRGPVNREDTSQRERIEAREELSRAEALMSRLSESQQHALRLASLGLTHSEVSRSTGQRLGTAKTNLRRGMIRLRRLAEEVVEA